MGSALVWSMLSMGEVDILFCCLKSKMFKFLFKKPSQPHPEHAVREQAFKKAKDKHLRTQIQCNMRFAHTNNPDEDRRLVRDSTVNGELVFDGKGPAALARSSMEHR